MSLDSIQRDAREAAAENMRRSYQLKNESLEIKVKTMHLLWQKMKLLEEKAQNCEGEELFRIIELQTLLGKAIMPD